MGLDRTFLAAACAALVTTAATPAGAVVMVATYRGVVASGTDMTGLFGQPNGNLAGRSYVARYYYDTELGVRETTALYDRLRGGTHFGTVSPVHATLSISGFTLDIPGLYDGYAQTSELLDYIQHGVEDYAQLGPFDYISNRMEFFADLPGASFLEAEIPQTAVVVDGWAGIYTYYDATSYTVYTNMFFDGPATLKVAAVPEPATWGLMLLGFGAVGVFLRRGPTRRPAPAPR